MRKYILLAVILLIGIAFFFFGGNTNNNEYKVFKNAVMPTPVQIAGFALGDDVPFLAVNLLKFKEKAEYGDGRALVGPDGIPIVILWNHVDDILAHGPTLDKLSEGLKFLLDTTVEV